MKRLLVCDSYDLAWVKSAYSESLPRDSWHLLPLGISPASFQQRSANDLKGLPNWEVVGTRDIPDTARSLVKEFVLDSTRDLPYMDLGGATLAEMLQATEGNHWWWLQTSEKNPLRDPLVGQLYRVAMVRLVMETTAYDEVWLQVAEAPVRAAIRSATEPPTLRVLPTRDRKPKRWWDTFPLLRHWVHVGVTLANFLGVKIILALTRWPWPRALNGGLFFFTMYPYWWLRPAELTAQERFFSQLPHPSNQYLTWLVWPLKIWSKRRGMADLIRTRRLVPLQRYLSVFDGLRILSPRLFGRTVRFQRHMRRHLEFDLLGCQVGPLIANDLARSLTGSSMFGAFLLSGAIRKFAEETSPQAIVHRLEFQTDENSLHLGASGCVQTVGFLHSPIVDNFLPMRFTHGELSGKGEAAHARLDRPLPDSVLVCGSGGAGILTGDGFPEERISTCGPQRHGPLLTRLSTREPRKDTRGRLGLQLDEPILLVALALLEAETEGLFCALAGACAGTGMRLQIKTHPNQLGEDKALTAALADMAPGQASIVPAGADIYEYIAASDALLCIGSWIAFDAMALGVMPLVFQDAATFAGTSLESYERGLFTVRDAIELRTALDDVFSSGPTSTEKRGHWPEITSSVFGDLETPLAPQLSRGIEHLDIGVSGDQPSGTATP